MFGFSLTKLLVLALIIGAVIIGYRVFGRAAAGSTGGKPDADTFDTEYDAETDSYVVRGDKARDE